MSSNPTSPVAGSPTIVSTPVEINPATPQLSTSTPSPSIEPAKAPQVHQGKPTPTFTASHALDKAKAIRKHVMTFLGKEKMNPHVWLRDNLTPHVAALESKDTAIVQGAVAAIAKLPSEPTPSVKVKTTTGIGFYNKDAEKN